MNKLPIVVALLASAAMACGRSRAPARDSALARTLSSAVATGAAPQGPLCPRTGHWGECQLRIRLEQSGLAPAITAEKVGDLPTIGSAPVSFQVGNAGLAVYFFSDSMDRRRAAARLDTTKFIPPSRAVGIHGEATFIQSDNLLALLFTRNEHQRERVADAISAGPPQP